LSCLSEVDPDNCIAPITPYVVMRVGQVKLLPYVRPGDPAMGNMIRALKGEVTAVLLANHGPVVAGPDLRGAVFAAEELEETAKLIMMVRQLPHNTLNAAQIEELLATFVKGK
jgi:ribulose-5-phosphate 4-epimerase/fuculose-1-phosphate aldolase